MQVVRIAGDESLVDALARELEERAHKALRWNDLVSSAVASWDERLLDLQDLSSVSRSHLVTQIEAARDAQNLETVAAQKAAEAHDTTIQARHRLQRLELALRRRSAVPKLIEELNELNAVLYDNSNQQGTATEDLRAASLALGLDENRRAEVDRWERLRAYRRRALQRAKSDEDRVLSQLGDDERPTQTELVNRQTNARQRLQAAEDAAVDLGLTDDVRRLGIKLEAPLREAPVTVLKQTVAITNRPITGQALLAGIRRRRADLDGRPTSAEEQAVKDEREAAERQIRLLDDLEQLMSVTDRKRTNLDEAESELHELLDQPQVASQIAYESALDRLRQLQEVRANLLQQRDSMRLHLASLLDVEVPDMGPVDSSASGLTDEDIDELEEQKLLSNESEGLSEDPTVSTQEEDRLNIPVNGSDWEAIWLDTISAENRASLQNSRSISPWKYCGRRPFRTPWICCHLHWKVLHQQFPKQL